MLTHRVIGLGWCMAKEIHFRCFQTRQTRFGKAMCCQKTLLLLEFKKPWVISKGKHLSLMLLTLLSWGQQQIKMQLLHITKGQTHIKTCPCHVSVSQRKTLLRLNSTTDIQISKPSFLPSTVYKVTCCVIFSLDWRNCFYGHSPVNSLAVRWIRLEGTAWLPTTSGRNVALHCKEWW